MSCPPARPAGTYIIQAVYNGTTNFLGYTDNSHDLMVSAAATATAAASASATFSTCGQNVPLNATVTSAAGTVNEGTETFTILSGTTADRHARHRQRQRRRRQRHLCPARRHAGRHLHHPGRLQRHDQLPRLHRQQPRPDGQRGRHGDRRRQRLGDFQHVGQNVPLNATMTSPAGTVNEGTETFTILNGTTPIGTPVTVNVCGGAASASYVLPGRHAGRHVHIQAVYNGTANFAGYTDTSHALTVSAAATATAAANASVTFSTSARTCPLNAT